MKDNAIYYSVGALLYCPANNKTVAEKLINGEFGDKFSLAFCLEDTINDSRVAEAEEILVNTIQQLGRAVENDPHLKLPKLFIRVRYPGQITDLLRRFGVYRNLITGFNAPKFSAENSELYLAAMTEVNSWYDHTFYFMPILESMDLVDPRKRYDFLYYVKDSLQKLGDIVLNVRVGGNDLCHLFGLRRHCYESIYDVKPVATILTDILTVFSTDYVVSGPVWEYYAGEGWDTGMTTEIAKDLVAGFVGKTVIHPKQIHVLNNASKVLKSDYEDAKSILGWSDDAASMVSGSCVNSRMNEAKTHTNWAKQTLYMAEYYGLK